MSDVDTKLCPDCNAKLAKKIIKWPQVFEAYWCKACKLDYFREDVVILPNRLDAEGITDVRPQELLG